MSIITLKQPFAFKLLTNTILIVVMLTLYSQTSLSKADLLYPDDYIDKCLQGLSNAGNEHALKKPRNSRTASLVSAYVRTQVMIFEPWIQPRQDIKLVINVTKEGFVCYRFNSLGNIVARYSNQKFSPKWISSDLYTFEPEDDGHSFVFKSYDSGKLSHHSLIDVDDRTGDIFKTQYYPDKFKSDRHLEASIILDTNGRLKSSVDYKTGHTTIYYNLSGMPERIERRHCEDGSSVCEPTSITLSRFDAKNNLLSSKYINSGEETEVNYHMKVNERGDWIWRQRKDWSPDTAERRIIIYR